MAVVSASGTAMQRAARQRGFTVIEVLVTMAIVAFLAAMAIPAMSNMVKNSKLRGASSDFFGDLLVARSEAVKQNCNVTLAPAATSNWTGGWTVTSNGTAPNACTNGAVTLSTHTALDSEILALPATADSIVYGSNGRVSAGQQTVIFYESTTGTGLPARCVSVDASGAPRVTLDTNGDPSDGCN